ncbi:hypothetical protein QUB33_24500 [Microcoleus sp. B3-A4]|uniref:hypothetical protein n=1 Tax=Microcoleus sp. B3-A4 TaxID=2818653 RepID=UPI002FD16375
MMNVTQTAPKPATTVKVWEDASPLAAVGDIIRKAFCPIARVVGKEILANGCICLIVFFPGCLDHHSEEWVLEAPAVPATATATATGTNGDEPPNRGDNRRGRMQPATKTDKALAAIFNDRPKQYQQFLIIREELAAIGIKLGKLISSREDAKGWRLDWEGDKAGLFWTVGNDWEIASLKYETELTGNWEGFDLVEHLDCNGIELPE